MACATGNILKVEPSSYWPCTARLNSGLSDGSPFSSGRGRSLGSKSGRLAMATTSPVLTSIRMAAAPLAFITFMPFASTSCIAVCAVMSIDSVSGAPALAGSRSQPSNAFSTPAMPSTSALDTPSAPKRGPAQDVAGQMAVGIKPHLARAEQQAGFADVVHGLHLFGRQLLLDPDEAALAGEVARQRGLGSGRERSPASSAAACLGSIICWGWAYSACVDRFVARTRPRRSTMSARCEMMRAPDACARGSAAVAGRQRPHARADRPERDAESRRP